MRNEADAVLSQCEDEKMRDFYQSNTAGFIGAPFSEQSYKEMQDTQERFEKTRKRELSIELSIKALGDYMTIDERLLEANKIYDYLSS